MQPLRESLERLLEAHEPNPALIADGLWNLIESNRAASLLWDGVDPELLEPPINMLRLGVHPGGLPETTLRFPIRLGADSGQVVVRLTTTVLGVVSQPDPPEKEALQQTKFRVLTEPPKPPRR